MELSITLMNGDPALQRRILHLEGDSYQQGLTHGRLARDLIERNLEALHRRSIAHPPEGLGVLLQRNLSFVARRQPELHAELQGLAEGSGLSWADVLLLNLPLHFVLGWLGQECSQFVRVLRQPDGSTATLVGKTRDMGSGAHEHVVLVRRYPDGLAMVEVGLAGAVTFPGSVLTSRGVAVTTSGVWSPRTPFDQDALEQGEILPNAHALARSIGSLEDVEPVLARSPRLTGINYVVAQPGRAAAFEVTGRSVRRLDESDTAVIRTNHYRSGGFRDLSPTPAENPSSHSRYRRLSELVPAISSIGDAWRVLTDHQGYPQGSICRHREACGAGSDTVYASLFVLEEGRALVALGHPCAVGAPYGVLSDHSSTFGPQEG